MDIATPETRRLGWARTLSTIIAILAVVASLGGLLIHGLYRGDPAWLPFAVGNDLVTLVLAVPIFIAALILSRRGSERWNLLWLGTLYYMLYNFAYYVFGAPVNKLFLVYLGLFTLPAFALVFGLTSLHVVGLSRKFRAKTPVKWVSAYMLLWAALVGGTWISQWLRYVVTGRIPQVNGSENAYKLIAAVDLSMLVAVLAPAAIWLWKRRPWGYVLAIVINVQGALYTTVLAAGSIASARAGIPGSLVMLPVWIGFCVGSLACLVAMLVNLEPAREGKPL